MKVNKHVCYLDHVLYDWSLNHLGYLLHFMRFSMTRMTPSQLKSLPHFMRFSTTCMTPSQLKLLPHFMRFSMTRMTASQLTLLPHFMRFSMTCMTVSQLTSLPHFSLRVQNTSLIIRNNASKLMHLWFYFTAKITSYTSFTKYFYTLHPIVCYSKVFIVVVIINLFTKTFYITFNAEQREPHTHISIKFIEIIYIM
jgi:hypothetical protein